MMGYRGKGLIPHRLGDNFKGHSQIGKVGNPLCSRDG